MANCSGNCCAVFSLPYAPAEFARRAPKITDGAFIADMIVPLTPRQAQARAEKFGIQYPKSRKTRYTCRHWNEDTRLCGVYDDRPEMCRGYPYGNQCAHKCGFWVDPLVLLGLGARYLKGPLSAATWPA